MQYRKPFRSSANTIDCEINHPRHGWIPFTCDPNDTQADLDTAELFTRIGAEATLDNWIEPPTPDPAIAAAYLVRQQRNKKLETEVDVIVMNSLRWGALSQEQRDAIAVYRQALLDVTDQAGFPFAVVWP
jgi:hypothetical protein